MATEQDQYLISVAAEMLGMHPQTLRKYERLGLIQPSRTVGSMRLYSQEEIERIRPLMEEGALSTGAGRRQLVTEMRRLNDALGM